MDNPLFSIIVPVYNVEKYIHRCIDSLITQDFFNYEIILVNDGSSDQSGVICDMYAQNEDRIRVFHQKNCGVSEARNKGLSEAHGQWILFVDSDDYISSNALSKIYAALMQYPNVDVILWGFFEKTIEHQTIARALQIPTPYLYNKEEIRTCILSFFCESSFLNSPCTKAFKTSIIKSNEIRFRKRVRGEDWLFCLEYFRLINSAATISDLFYYYVRNVDSAMNKYCKEQYELWEENFQYRKDLIKDFNLEINWTKMNNLMLLKIFYYMGEILRNESRINSKKHFQRIFQSEMFEEILSYPIKGLKGKIIKFLLGMRSYYILSYSFILNGSVKLNRRI